MICVVSLVLYFNLMFDSKRWMICVVSLVLRLNLMFGSLTLVVLLIQISILIHRSMIVNMVCNLILPQRVWVCLNMDWDSSILGWVIRRIKSLQTSFVTSCSSSLNIEPVTNNQADNIDHVDEDPLAFPINQDLNSLLDNSPQVPRTLSGVAKCKRVLCWHRS